MLPPLTATNLAKLPRAGTVQASPGPVVGDELTAQPFLKRARETAELDASGVEPKKVARPVLIPEALKQSPA